MEIDEMGVNRANLYRLHQCITMHVYSCQLSVPSVSNQRTSPNVRDLVMNAEISKRHHTICPAQAATLTDLTHTGYSESHCGHVRKRYSNASEICQKYNCPSTTQLAAPTYRLLFFQTNKVCFFFDRGDITVRFQLV